MKRNNHIARLLALAITHAANDAEEQELRQWAAGSPARQRYLDRLLSDDARHDDRDQRAAIDIRRPLADMQARIVRDLQAIDDLGIHDGWLRRNATTLLVAASLLVVVGIGITYYRLNQATRQEQAVANATTTKAAAIHHGEMKASLTLASGETVDLGTDTLQNNRLLADAEQHAATIAAAQQLRLTTPAGGEFKVTLEDGTEVWLNADSRLVYPQTFAGNERRVEVAGEAYFKVAKDQERPFYVTCGGQEVRVYGTEFNINTFGDAGEILTTLITGKIALRPTTGEGGELVLTPGHQAVFANGKARVKTVDTDVVTSWRQGKFVFEDQNLAQIMRTLSRWYNFTYKFHDRKIQRTAFMGSVPRYGSFDEVLRILELSGNIRFEVHGTQVDIYRK